MLKCVVLLFVVQFEFEFSEFKFRLNLSGSISENAKPFLFPYPFLAQPTLSPSFSFSFPAARNPTAGPASPGPARLPSHTVAAKWTPPVEGVPIPWTARTRARVRPGHASPLACARMPRRLAAPIYSAALLPCPASTAAAASPCKPYP